MLLISFFVVQILPIQTLNYIIHSAIYNSHFARNESSFFLTCRVCVDDRNNVYVSKHIQADGDDTVLDRMI